MGDGDLLVALRNELHVWSMVGGPSVSWAYERQESSLKLAARQFGLWMARIFSDVEIVNKQQERHCYTENDMERHADALVIIRDPADPSKDFVVDFCYGVSEPGILARNLTFTWHPERLPYDWWTDNAFTEGCD